MRAAVRGTLLALETAACLGSPDLHRGAHAQPNKTRKTDRTQLPEGSRLVESFTALQWGGWASHRQVWREKTLR